MQTLFDSNKAKYMIKAGIKYIIYYLHSEQSAKYVSKGRLIWKANCQAVISSKIRTNEFDRFYYYATCFRYFFGRN